MQRSKIESANSLTHLLGALLSIPAGWYITSKGLAKDDITGLSMLVFSSGIFILYLSSTLYHWIVEEKRKLFFRHIDHASIYVLIAASYTPICLCVVGGNKGNLLCLILWIVAIIGIIGKIIALGKYPKLSLVLYLIMGWSVLFVIKPVWQNMSTNQLLWLLVEGICYTAGTYFYAHKENPSFHVIWHLFVLGGTISQYMVALPLVY